MLRIYPIALISQRGTRSNGSRIDLAKELIYESIENALGIPREDVISRSRKHELVQCRVLASYIGKNLLKLKWRQCGLIIDRDHSTAIHNHDSHNPDYEQDHKNYRQHYHAVLGELLGLMLVKEQSFAA